MFRVEYFCGERFGGWRAAGPSYEDRDLAEIETTRQILHERAARLTPLARRVVPAQSAEQEQQRRAA